MKNISIIYWSGTGNTEKMATLINEGLQEKTENPKLLNVSQASIKDVETSDLVILGSPSMGSEVIEEYEMEPFIEDIKFAVNGKKIALFGSYGWGNGEWMRDWEKRMSEYGAILTCDSLMVQDTPLDENTELCIEFGRSLS
jgi:flavodoxin short chain